MRYEKTYEGKPHGWIQWKGTDVCVDLYCKCGKQGHLDVEFMYNIKCKFCGRIYKCNGHIQLIELDEEPDNTILFGDEE